MNREETIKVLRTLRAGGFRCPDMDETFVDEWARSMLAYDFDTGQQAAWSWLDNEDRWPTMNQWLDRVQSVARGKATERAQLALPPSAGDRRKAASILAAIRDAHEGGATGEALHQEVMLRLHDAGIGVSTTSETSYECSGCQDSGLVRYDRQTGGEAYRPCPACNPNGALRWAEGHYDSGHSCGACDAIRGRKVRTREAVEA